MYVFKTPYIHIGSNFTVASTVAVAIVRCVVIRFPQIKLSQQKTVHMPACPLLTPCLCLFTFHTLPITLTHTHYNTFVPYIKKSLTPNHTPVHSFSFLWNFHFLPENEKHIKSNFHTHTHTHLYICICILGPLCIFLFSFPKKKKIFFGWSF